MSSASVDNGKLLSKVFVSNHTQVTLFESSVFVFFVLFRFVFPYLYQQLVWAVYFQLMIANLMSVKYIYLYSSIEIEDVFLCLQTKQLSFSLNCLSDSFALFLGGWGLYCLYFSLLIYKGPFYVKEINSCHL